jgi:hypothetical protein
MAGGETGRCHGNPYLIPQLYVENLESNVALELRDGEARLVRGGCNAGARCFGKAIYGVLLEEIADLVGKKARRAFIVVLPPDYTEGLLVEAGTYLEPIPLEGMRVVVEACEGEKVKPGSTLGFIATRKLEVRHIRSHVEGVVVYIYSDPEAPPDRNIVFIAREEDVKHVRVRREEG